MKNDWFKGVVVPLVTPLTSRQAVDVPALESLIERQISAGVNGIFVLGSAGEGPLLTRAMQHQVVRTALQLTAGQVPVLAGVTDNSVELVLERIEEFAPLGIKAAVATLPYYGWSDNPACAVEFFTAVADRSPLPVVPYNLPKVVRVAMNAATIREFYGHPNIAGVKDTNTDQATMEELAADAGRPKEFKYLPGNSALALHLLKLGADGFVPAPGNVMPEVATRLYADFLDGRLASAQALADCLGELNKVGNYPTTTGGIKMAMELLGLCSRTTVRPWPQANAQHAEQVSAILGRVQAMLASVAAPATEAHACA